MVCELSLHEAVIKKFLEYPIFEDTHFFFFSLKSSEKVYSSFRCAVAFGKQHALGLFAFVSF